MELTLTPIKQDALKPLLLEHNNDKPYMFTLGKNDFTGLPGWKPIDIQNFDPVVASMVVHDILEHFPKDEYEPHNEYQAQGAMFWLRFEGEYYQRTAPAVSAISSVVVPNAFGLLFFNIFRNSLSTLSCPFVREAHDPLPAIKTDHEMIRVLGEAQRYIDGTFKIPNQPEKDKITAEVAAVIEGAKIRLTNSLAQALGWMRIGYRRAAQRYLGVDKKRLVSLYIDLQGSIERLTPTASTKSRLIVHIDYKSYKARASLEDVIEA